ncbi:MAG TPA: ankyrin repeat domain-containing protein [Parachlamydiaceae bacterium]|nr:ankyrin repeat domain-containing protein [Parachlamydiaceae bacterium]
MYKIKPHIPSDFVHLVVNADCIPLLNRLKEKPILYDLESETETIFNLSAVDENREQPLHQVKSIEAAKILIEGGAEINKENTIGQTPLTKALLNNRPDIAKCLIENGAKIEPQDEELMANTKYQK